MDADLVNASFEGLGGLVILLNVRRILRDRIVRGVDWRVMAFFFAWGLWNLYYYPHLGQTWSFFAGIGIAAANAVYLGLLIYYVNKEREP